ncbi:MAG TPA: hypothetical protein VF017_08870 [Thermoanaerobaculia bacterium]|nr:hypothetical protein [Thermoanaerobaculia bacterium]
MTHRARLVLPAVCLALFPLATRAADEATCRHYADEAVQAQARNLGDHCGFAGDPWSGHWQNHFNWCLGASLAQVQSETNGRRGALEGCRRCSDYAREAFEAHLDNIASSCGFAGDPWSFNTEGHRQWCLAVSPADAANESAARRGALQECRRCSDYARQATEAQQRNVTLHCGLRGDAWSYDSMAHRQWCLVASPADADRETAARRAALDRCDRCTQYAREAVAAQQKNQNFSCGLKGDAWSFDEASHRQWCMVAPEDRVQLETNLRAGALSRCLSVCTEYANQAVAAQRQNQATGCNLAGDRWSSNYQEHAAWCVTASPASAEAETRERTRLLSACTPDRRNTCDAYADHARVQNAERIQRGCGRDRQTRWHDNYQNHYQWCLLVPISEPGKESAAREEWLQRCRGERSPGISTGECRVSVIVRNGSCQNLDGTPSDLLPPGSRSAIGCGPDRDTAKGNAVFSMMTTGVCLVEEDEPSPGCCTFAEEAVDGCLCQ